MQGRPSEEFRDILPELFESLNDALIIMDGIGTISFLNPAAQEMFEYSPPEILGRKFPDLLSNSCRVNFETYLAEDGPGPKRIGLALYAIKKSGLEFPVEASLSRFRSKDLFVLLIRDFTRHRKAEELEKLVEERTAEMATAMNFLSDEIHSRRKAELTLRENESKIRRLEAIKLMGELAAGVAHEVRNPLHALMSLTEALKIEIGDNVNLGEYLFHINTQVKRLSNLMKDLLDLGKPVEPASLRMESLPEICRASVEIFKNQPSCKIDVAVASPEKDVRIMAHSQRLQQVFINLFDNAAHHSPPESEIKLFIKEPEEDTIKIRVIDKGSGIPEEVLPRVFEPFFSTRRSGTGLGLNIVKNIIESHGGTISIRNNGLEGRPEAGCTAEITLPIWKGAP